MITLYLIWPSLGFAAGSGNKIGKYVGRNAGNFVRKQIEQEYNNRESNLAQKILEKRLQARANCLEVLYKALNTGKLNREQQKHLLREITRRLGNPEAFAGNRLTTMEIVERVKEGLFTSDDLKEIAELIRHPDRLTPEIVTVPNKSIPDNNRISRWFGQWTRLLFLGTLAMGMVATQVKPGR